MQVRDLQLLNREADHIEASTSAQTKFLDTIDGGEEEDVDSTIKRHEDFTKTMHAQAGLHKVPYPPTKGVFKVRWGSISSCKEGNEYKDCGGENFVKKGKGEAISSFL